jgi:tetratricopeptide (TPR) repeat protein
LRKIARVALSLGGFQEALSYYQRCAELAQDSADLHAEIIARTGSGNVRLWQGRWADAECCYLEVLGLLDAADSQDRFLLERAQLYNNLGNAATRQMQLSEAEAWFEKALEVWAIVQSPFDRAVCYHNKALLRDVQGRREEARECYLQALELPIPSGMWAGIAIDLAESYLRDGHASQAEELGRAAEERAISARSPYFLGRMYHGRGNIARALGDDGGFTFFEKALQIAREKGYPLLEGEALVDYARLRIQTGGEEEAQAYLDRAREIFTETGAIHELSRVEQVSQELRKLLAVSNETTATLYDGPPPLKSL